MAYEITKLIRFSPKRNAAFDRIKAEDRDDDLISRVGIRSFCPTRWTVRGASIASILENYNVLKKLWDECLEGSLIPKVKGRIIGVKAQMSNFKLLFGLHISERILMITDNLSKTLQTSSMSASEAQSIAGKTLETLKKMRNKVMFASFWKHVECLRSRTDTDEPTLPRKRKAPARYETGGEGSHADTVEDHYRRIYFEALDLAVTCIEERFNQPGYMTYRNLEELLVKAANKEDYAKEFEEIVSFYEDDFDAMELSTQLTIFSSSFTREGSRVTLREAIKYLQDLSAGERLFFKQVCRIAQLILVMPATNAASERSFSAMKPVKTYLRSTMGQARLNHLMTLIIYKDEAEKLDLKVVANEFIRGKEHRVRFFGNFT